ncbi:ABC transporter ATP-binding protein [Mesorhizobium sp. M1C.F.Ca.ET.193.01.1.1]|uniref:ABC transporter ATP-binding protein n=1 Tax=unclassified Mesorhizobium TaxID=325217 RepID=UPI000FD4A455|nr:MULTISPECIES: ABC transporter ATP-binding protein [unclassified Mesorhizobium]TGT04329.1 ABC transporter ATP-binding protein [bacterium M00.F.Ca.ET.177.01.1.1]TGQ56919.1 ABC transporter ATP-binding protein [Mesorhizobium sp. M1C.F.Ca.ET.210.01.1.1]TGQ75686.1 ABC transporter ATP-binding protein [Mesorhizobium sp. M1C.F.Ca.ET.212.01.1.1]TGR14095.1 ABC transporter ATP-binding protein [Mesorhizobium sp. M1C.F.Ca.ET.204.01.1.1]TGR34350.1 ABC transporter ATP-binding protein [Mesorhizobium sp. M1C
MADVQVRGVTKRFGETIAVNDLDLQIKDGEFVVLLGPTGAGKTTTLRLIAGLERPDSGTIHIGGHDATALSPAERDTAFVFQQYSLYPHLSVYDNLAFPLRSPARRFPEEAIRRRVEEVARMVRIDHKLNNRSTRLSGGEMQRVAIGRALVRKPAIYLMDEPLSSLDAKLRADLRLELKRIQSELGATMLYVTHDQIEAMTMADRIGILADGVLVQIGTPRAIYSEPANLHVAARLGQPAINLLPAGLLPDGGAPTGATTIGARTEHLSIEKAANGHADGVVDWVEHLGDQNHLHVTVGAKKLVTLTDPDTPLEKGDRVTIRYRSPLYFGSDGQRLM